MDDLVPIFVGGRSASDSFWLLAVTIDNAEQESQPRRVIASGIELARCICIG